jgi:hypothetical protein
MRGRAAVAQAFVVRSRAAASRTTKAAEKSEACFLRGSSPRAIARPHHEGNGRPSHHEGNFQAHHEGTPSFLLPVFTGRGCPPGSGESQPEKARRMRGCRINSSLHPEEAQCPGLHGEEPRSGVSNHEGCTKDKQLVSFVVRVHGLSPVLSLENMHMIVTNCSYCATAAFGVVLPCGATPVIAL